MSEPFLSEIKIMSFNFPPKGWALCNGQLLPINQNQALFSLLGTMYGGDGRVTFALPNIQGRVSLHFGQHAGGSSFVQGQQGGEASHTLVNGEMPTHTHAAHYSSNTDSLSPQGKFWAADTSGFVTFSTTADQTLSPLAIPAAGGSQPHENMAPYLTLSFCIALQGIFPSRN